LAGESSVGKPLTPDVIGHPGTLKKANHGDPYTFEDLRPMQQSPIADNSKGPKLQEGIWPPPLPPPNYGEYFDDTACQWGSPTGLQIDKNSPTGDYDRQSPRKFNRTGSASSLNFWSGSRRHSRAGSVVSSMNNSLHGYEVFDAGEQNIASPISAPQSAPGSGSGAQVSGFRLPPPPVELEKVSSFECDICGKKVSIKRKREWR
jgi:hypothetical protein